VPSGTRPAGAPLLAGRSFLETGAERLSATAGLVEERIRPRPLVIPAAFRARQHLGPEFV